MYTTNRDVGTRFDSTLSRKLDTLQIELEHTTHPLKRRWLKFRKSRLERTIPVLAALDRVHSYVGLCPVCGVDLGYPDGPDSEALCEPCRGAWL